MTQRNARECGFEDRTISGIGGSDILGMGGADISGIFNQNPIKGMAKPNETKSLFSFSN